ncbi:MAG: Rieske (2Fe-2S) protein [Candidatus Latescibacterota bacterium]|nr:MAG: Rieske (2Fe-2S) protein [Candidatus Latescibacterota bacterium]
MNRRGFVSLLLGGGILGWLGAVLYPIISYLNPPKVPEANVQTVKAGSASDFPKNTAQIVKFGRKPVILIKTNNDEFLAFAATCTHLDCIVQYRGDLKQIWCACHNGLYDLKGRNISGPPPKPLDEYAVNIVEDEIHISEMG